MIKELDLKNVKYFNHEILETGFWSDQFYDKFKLHYNQWWKLSKTIKIKRKQSFSYPYGHCDITRITHNHSNEGAMLLGTLNSLDIPCLKI